MKSMFLGFTIGFGIIVLADLVMGMSAGIPDSYFTDKIILIICLATYAILRQLEKGK